VSSFHHISVLPEATLQALAPKPGGRYVDFTLGAGGHAAAILDASAPDGTLVAFDRDPRAREAAAARLAPYGDRVVIHDARFSDAPAMLANEAPFDGWLADIGVSSPQIDDPERGFSFSNDGPLDMRMGDGPSAAEFIDGVSEDELAHVFRNFGEFKGAHRLARAVKADRAAGRLDRTAQLASLCERVLGAARKHHPATLPFQALRIAVNDELGELRMLLDRAPALLGLGGVAAVITFHSLEDRMAKQAFRALAESKPMPRGIPFDPLPPAFEWVARGIAADEAEQSQNPRSRTARLRAIRRVRVDGGTHG
jgi:16S rRNA (cytosine1402-N4)-methyltransferase